MFQSSTSGRTCVCVHVFVCVCVCVCVACLIPMCAMTHLYVFLICMYAMTLVYVQVKHLPWDTCVRVCECVCVCGSPDSLDAMSHSNMCSSS